MKVRGAIAVVTGASSGIGRATGVSLAKAGATVIGIARREDLLAESVSLFRRFSAASVAVIGDLSTRDGCESAAKEALEQFGRVDICVNNAGISIRKPAEMTSVDDVERVFAINFFAAVTMTYAVLPGMLERKHGSIVNVTSVAGTVPNPKESAYAASKAALAMWTHTLAVDLHGSGVHAGVVSPGPIDTEIWAMDEHPAAYKGKKYAPSIVGAAVVRAITTEKVHVTSPRQFGLPGVMYPILGRPMRWGLRRFDRTARELTDTTPTTPTPPGNT